MQTLITKLRADPSEKNRERVRVYLAKHPMAVLFLDSEDAKFLCMCGIHL